ncbi:MAG: family 4 glycosyl hydrolase [Armatimonadota bacterium]
MAGGSVKIVSIGAASIFGRGILADVLGSPEFNELDTTLVLVDINREALDRIYRLGLLMKEHFASRVQLEATTDRLEALPGANYVITSVAILRYELWEQDFRVPLAFGFKHVLGENGGPGAIFHALRNFELMIPIARDMERLCPNALLLNFTNPEPKVVKAVTDLTSIRCVGLCHGVQSAREGISTILGRPEDELDIVAGGHNHFFWVTKIADRRTGQDLYPLLRKRILQDPDCPQAPPLVKKMVEVFGLYTYPSDDHIGEYLQFASEFTGLLWHYGLETKRIPHDGLSPQPWPYEEYVDGRKPLDDCVTHQTRELAIPIILDIELDRKRWECAVNVPNNEVYIENLPDYMVVEVPAVVDRDGVHPEKIGPLPDALAAFCHRQATIQKLLSEAYAKRSKNLLLQCLLLDPVVDSVSRAEKMLDYMLELQKDFLPEFK